MLTRSDGLSNLEVLLPASRVVQAGSQDSGQGVLGVEGP